MNDSIIELPPSSSSSAPLWSRRKVWALAFLALMAIAAFTVFEWTVNRIYVEPGHSLLLTYKGPLIFGSHKSADDGQFAKVDEAGRPLEIGVLEELKGPGRHFYCPIWWKRQIIDDVVVQPGEVAIISSRLGESLSGKVYLVDAELGAADKFKGVLRKAYGPGRYRVNRHGYDVEIVKSLERNDGAQIKHSGWVSIPTGYVGVVTNLADNPRANEKAGIQSKVLQPGLYPLNPKASEVDIVEVGYFEKSLAVQYKTDSGGHLVFDAAGEPQLDPDDPGGISFPSNDGFTIHMDFTAVWGILPEQAPNIVQRFGNVEAVETKIVVPQIESICRNTGSKFAAVALLVGDSRRAFQDQTAQAFQKALEEKGVSMLNGLVRYISIPQEVRTPIQMGYIADELKLTRDQQQLTAKTEADLRESEKKVDLEAARIETETTKMAAKVKAEGDKTAEETRAETLKMMAAIDKQTAGLDAQATILLGEAGAQAQQLMAEARAEKFKLAVGAFGSGSAYNQWVFASGLPNDMKLSLLYAGQGTFWTDLKGFSETLLGRQAQQKPPTPTPTRNADGK